MGVVVGDMAEPVKKQDAKESENGFSPEYDYVLETLAHAVESIEDASGYLHIGEDDAYNPLGGYWIPVNEDCAEMNHPPHGELIRYPADDRDPSMVGKDSVPSWVEA